ncbi:tyrosine-type recombinase/integrase [Rhizobium sp. RAF56]|uniref:tyrosine-type recombinase/integrase n=1 Tax=Rhizobium sp. RAF56 TaxID=3233062 RepID=UPI003F9EB27B
MAAINKLSAAKVAKLDEPGLYADGGNLYLQVSQVAKRITKSWIFRYTINGKARAMGLGSVDAFTLKEARERARIARQLLADGIDPLAEKAAKKAATAKSAASRMTFRQAAEGYMSSHRAGWSDAHTRQWETSLETYVFPLLGDLDVAAIDVGLVMKVIQPLWVKKTVTADRCRNRIELVLDWAKSSGHRSGENPAVWRGHLDKLLPKISKVAEKENLAAMPYAELPVFMQRLRATDGNAARALEFTILTAARSGETFGATWAEIDLDNGLWIVPKERMKAGKEHRVPLPDAAVKLLRGLPQGKGPEAPVFTGGRGGPLRRIAMLDAMRTAGGDGVTVHGFRSAFRDWVSECTAFPGELAEVALAHATGNVVERSYKRGDVIDKRRKLMEAWATFLASTAGADSSGKVIPLKGGVR